MFGNFFQKKNNANAAQKSQSPDNLRVFKLEDLSQAGSSRQKSPRNSPNSKASPQPSPRQTAGTKAIPASSSKQNLSRPSSNTPSKGSKSKEQKNQKDIGLSRPISTQGDLKEQSGLRNKVSPPRSRNNKFVNEQRIPVAFPQLLAQTIGRAYGSNSPPKQTQEPVFSKRQMSPPTHSGAGKTQTGGKANIFSGDQTIGMSQSQLAGAKKKDQNSFAVNEEFLLYAKINNFEKCMEMLSGNTIVNANYVPSNGFSALDYAIENSNQKLVFLLLSCSCSPNRVNPLGLTSLMFAAKK